MIHSLLTHFSSVPFHMETSYLFCPAKQMTGFYMICNTGLKWVNESKTTYFSFLSVIHTFLNFHKKKPIGAPKTVSNISQRPYPSQYQFSTHIETNQLTCSANRFIDFHQCSAGLKCAKGKQINFEN